MVATTQGESGWATVAIIPCLVGLVALAGCGPTSGIGTDTDMIIGDDDDDATDGPDDDDDDTTDGPDDDGDDDDDDDDDDTTDGPDDDDDDDDATDTGPLEDHCTLEGEPDLAIGHGGGSFETFGDDAAVLVYGEQGGVHIDVALRAEHTDLSGAFVSDIRGYLDDVQVATGNGGGAFVCDPDTLYLLRDGIRLIFEIPPSQIDNQLFTVTAELTDSTGNLLMTEDAVWVVDPS